VIGSLLVELIFRVGVVSSQILIKVDWHTLAKRHVRVTVSVCLVIVPMDHGGPNRLIVVINWVLEGLLLTKRRLLGITFPGWQLRAELARLNVVVLLNHVSFAKVGHR